MHWGHFATEDFVHWESLPIALRPDEEYDALCGCCSGSVIDEKDGKLYLMYTAAQPERQRQCLAVSEDGIHFVKDPGDPILTAEMLDPEVSDLDFRDPRLFQKDGWYHFIAGVRIIDLDKDPPNGIRGAAAPARAPSIGPVRSPSAGSLSPSGEDGGTPSGGLSGASSGNPGYGNLILARSRDLYHWEYVGKLLREEDGYDPAFYHLDGVYECPDYIVFDDGTEVLLSSPQNLPRMGHRYQNIHSGLYMMGKLDFDTGRFRADTIEEVDAGTDFYAAQTLRMPDGRVILLAWKEMWDRSYPTQKEGWAGSYVLPRELSVEDGRLIQRPVREIRAYLRDTIRIPELRVDGEAVSLDGIQGDTIELRFTLEPGSAARAGVELFCGPEHATRIYYDRDEGAVIFDRSRSGIVLTGRDADVQRRYCDIGRPDAIESDLFLDVCSVEVFLDGGRHTMTGNVYPDEGDISVRFFSEGGACRFRDIEKSDIVP